uniref:Uncharacterized protein n=1 Tax=Octopus bimaculoides TaxID=37653 RepID=A0A0L8HKN8_OCTBM
MWNGFKHVFEHTKKPDAKRNHVHGISELISIPLYAADRRTIPSVHFGFLS